MNSNKLVNMLSLAKLIGLLVIFIFSLSINVLLAQETEGSQTKHPYKHCLKADIPITVIGMAGTAYGFYRRENKTNYDSAYVLSLDPNSLSRIDRGVINNNSLSAGHVSDILLASGFVLPAFLIADKSVRNDLGRVSMMYLETMAITGMGYWLSAGLVDKPRPYVYNKDVSINRRINKHSKDSFYGGHISVTAAGTFFIAKVYSDYHPESSFKYFLWSFAGAATVANSLARYYGGFHFPSDIAIGAAVGTTIGILVPVLHHHKNKEPKISLSPFIGEYKGLTIGYKLNNKLLTRDMSMLNN